MPQQTPKRTLESPAIALLMHAGLFAFVVTVLQFSEGQASRVVAAPVPAAGTAAPIAPETLRALRAQAERYGSTGLSGSLTLLPTLYELSSEPPPSVKYSP